MLEACDQRDIGRAVDRRVRALPDQRAVGGFHHLVVVGPPGLAVDHRLTILEGVVDLSELGVDRDGVAGDVGGIERARVDGGGAGHLIQVDRHRWSAVHGPAMAVLSLAASWM